MSHISLTSAAIACHNVSKTFTGSTETLSILAGVTLEIKQGDTIAITGISGSGKTTLLSILAGLDRPTAGEVWLNSQRIDQLDEEARAAVRRGTVGFIFQSFHLLPHLTALENVLLPLELTAHRNPHEQATEMLRRVGLAKRLHHTPQQLSGGEQQRVAIARAFAIHPAILFADEPTGNLDHDNGHLIADLLFTLNREHATTLVLVTHDLDLAKRCQRHVAMHNGTVQEVV
ncbi:ABC transporter ATP-binding protein [Chrysiogenes arsenatis]|uniref:ABC transporter ATP-binding protein n=1 Tax=Chrysiogenes arsenatis TaxID=309797 RepID=UPI000410F428|nr:ABC transporter ATP-binding protein [Chrysiogenes arsenatis]